MAQGNLGADDRFWTVADRFVRFVFQQTGLKTIVCGPGGVIRVAIDQGRIGTTHSGAQKILKGEVDEYCVTAEEAAANPMIREGLNAPVVVNDQRVATFGITAKLEISRPIARVAAGVLSSWVKELDQQARLREVADEVMSTAGVLSKKVARANASAEQISRRMTQAAELMVKKVTLTDGLVRTVQQIAQQSHILSINGSVEAARAGQNGKGFAVVAKEMMGLATSARKASDTIQTVLGEIRGAIDTVQAAVGESAEMTREQADSLRLLLETVQGLPKALADVAAAFETQA